MKTKTLVVLLVILAIAVGAGIFLFRSPDVPVNDDALGALIFEALPANEIASIVIDRPDGSVMLVKEKEIWIVKNRFWLPRGFFSDHGPHSKNETDQGGPEVFRLRAGEKTPFAHFSVG